MQTISGKLLQPTGRKVCKCTTKMGFILLPKPCEWELEKDPQCWKTEQVETETPFNVEKDVEPSPVTNRPEIRKSTAENQESTEVCSSDLPTDDDWFCDNTKACFLYLSLLMFITYSIIAYESQPLIHSQQLI